MKKLRVVQIGAEHDHAGIVMETLRRLKDVFEVVAYAVPEGETVLSPNDYEGVLRLSPEEALNTEGIDAVIVETGEKNLTKYALLAAENGFAVHMDKPGGVELSDFETLTDTARKNKTVLHLGYMYRYNPEIIALLKDIKNGRLGEIYSVESHMSCMHTDKKRQWLEKFKGGMTFYLGCHLIDLIYRIQGEPLDVLPLNCSTGIDGVAAEDYGMAVLKYKNGISFAKTCAVEAGGFMRRQLTVCGSKGTVTLSPLEAYVGSEIHTGKREVYGDIFNWHYDGVHTYSDMFDRYENMMRAFAEYVCGDKENPYTYDYELNLYKLLLKACGGQEQ